MSWETANALLHQHTRDVLGPRPDDRHIYIMVTAPSAKEADRAWMVRMLGAGMNVLRINCAHEGEREWGQMIRALREARVETGKKCRVLMDLAGPKIRTGPVAAPAPDRDVEARQGRPRRGHRSRARRHPPCLGAPVTQGADPFCSCATMCSRRCARETSCAFATPEARSAGCESTSVGRDELDRARKARAYVLDQAEGAALPRGANHVGDVTMRRRHAPGAAIDVKIGRYAGA